MTPPARTATVLVVEDDPELRELFREALSANRYRVSVASDGLAALQAIDQAEPDVVVLDLGLPCVSGWDVYRELRSPSTTADPLIVVVTASEPQDIRPPDVAAFLHKPVDPLVLVDTVAAILRR